MARGSGRCGASPALEPVITEGSVRHFGGTLESLATGVNEAGLAVGRYQESWLTDYPLAWDAAVDAVADLNDLSRQPRPRRNPVRTAVLDEQTGGC